MARLAVPSFAKINWILKILGRRPDGYHQVETVYQTIDLQDDLVFEPLPEPRIQVETRGRPVAGGEENLIHRAAILLQQAGGVRTGARIELDKRIPVGAGLGGGSGNAAVTLLVLNRLWKCSLPAKTLEKIGAHLGSDVPFFLTGGTALGTGRGTRIQPLSDRAFPQSLIVFYAPLQISSRAAYGLCDWGTYDGSKSLTKAIAETTMRRLFRGLRADGVQDSFLENDFGNVLFTHYPVLARAREVLEKLGCEGIIPCGSGSALLAVADRDRAEKVVREVPLNCQGEAFVCHSLSRDHYQNLYRKLGVSVF